MPSLTAYFALALAFAPTPSQAQNNEFSFGCDLALAAPQNIKSPALRIARLKSATFDARRDVDAIYTDTDLLFLDRPSVGNIRDARNANSGYFLSPTGMRWIRPIEWFETFLNELPLRERAPLENQLAISDNLVRAEIRPLTQKDFHKWYKIYAKSHVAKGRRSHPIKASWAKELGYQLKNYDSLFFYDKKSGDLLGGVILDCRYDRLVALYEAYSVEAQPLKLELRAFAEIMDHGAEYRFPTLEYVQEALVGEYSPASSVAFNVSLKMHAYSNHDRRLVKLLNTNILNRNFVLFAFESENDNLVAHYFTDQADAIHPIDFFPFTTVQVHDLRDTLTDEGEH